MIFTRTLVSLALLSLRKNGGLLVVYIFTSPTLRVAAVYLELNWAPRSEKKLLQKVRIKKQKVFGFKSADHIELEVPGFIMSHPRSDSVGDEFVTTFYDSSNR